MNDRANNFDALRFWAALAVLWSHAFPIALGSDQPQPLATLSQGQTNLGRVAVAVFFVISGFLITRSFERSADWQTFVRARALRIMPALIVVLVGLAFIVGPLLTRLPIPEYLSSSEPYRYVLLHASFSGHAELPGVFEQNPVDHANDSLWTLRYEVMCYALVFALGVSRLLHRYVTLALYAVITVTLAVLDFRYGGGVDTDLPGPDRALDFIALFLAGALIHQWKVPLRIDWAWVCFTIAFAALLFGGYKTAQRTVVPYVVLTLAQGVPWRIPSPIKLGDLSYGIYIYAWPVTQLAVMVLPQPTWIAAGVIATPITLLLAWLSWHTIEKRALALKRTPQPSAAS